MKIKILVIIVLAAVNLLIPFAGFAAENKVIAYYFHGSFRCATCQKLEQYSKKAIEANFQDELAKGTLEFKPVNVEKKENEHFVDDYQIYTKSLILSKVEDNKELQYKNLDKIWEYVNNKRKFSDYVVSEVGAYLKE